ncbi:MAG TPA: aromatic ring-hydroxylating dioxygenase subunit alpha [Mesorhizobium sp.]|jgi:phenylpropionate dioxygenase-like ring-hydroxylating dioxygenase large terminal subunit|nr:aromatic ring-hydroxylating dioxygenase subunit alpha [Mesorhizobium sp.]
MNAEWETLPAWTYNSAEVFAEEKEKVFLSSWQLVGHVNEIKSPGEYLKFDLLDQSAIVVRGEDEEIGAFHNVCRHRAFRLLDGDKGECKKTIRCLYHGWSYDFSGRLSGVPNQDTFEGLDRDQFGLKPIEMEIVLGLIFVRFKPGGPSLAEEIKPILEPLGPYQIERMEPFGPHAIAPIRADWKIAVENNSEAYHVPIGHPGLQRLYGTTYQLQILGNGTSTGGGPLCEQTRRSTWSERHYLKLLPDVEHLPEDRRRSWRYYSTFPNLAFDIYPDQIDYFQILPVAPGRCVSRARAYALPDNRREMRAARWLNQRINAQVGMEDVGLVEGAQAGLASLGYGTGLLSKKEARIKLFQDRIREIIPMVRSPTPPRRPGA